MKTQFYTKHHENNIHHANEAGGNVVFSLSLEDRVRAPCLTQFVGTCFSQKHIL
jgi:hypothetical protein